MAKPAKVMAQNSTSSLLFANQQSHSRRLNWQPYSVDKKKSPKQIRNSCWKKKLLVFAIQLTVYDSSVLFLLRPCLRWNPRLQKCRTRVESTNSRFGKRLQTFFKIVGFITIFSSSSLCCEHGQTLLGNAQIWYGDP